MGEPRKVEPSEVRLEHPGAAVVPRLQGASVVAAAVAGQTEVEGD